ncbi:MAG: hypothetical protein AAF215_02415 [Cyanobacteria bacterium P01_A01_bin.123]
MERGLLWLPLLGVFAWLAWAGWNEYRKVEAYKTWAAQFEKAKYDIYAVLGQNQATLTWGQPTRQGPVNLSSASLATVESLSVQIDGKIIDLKALPKQAGRPMLVLSLMGDRQVEIPFTDLTLAIQWSEYLQKQVQKFQHDSSTPT